jgi:hypothetical protein
MQNHSSEYAMLPEHLSDKFITMRKCQLLPPYSEKRNWQFESILFASRDDRTVTFDAELCVDVYST